MKQIINTQQHAFVLNRSVEFNILLYRSSSLRKQTNVYKLKFTLVNADFSKAFEKLSHLILFERVAKAGMVHYYTEFNPIL